MGDQIKYSVSHKENEVALIANDINDKELRIIKLSPEDATQIGANLLFYAGMAFKEGGK